MSVWCTTCGGPLHSNSTQTGTGIPQRICDQCGGKSPITTRLSLGHSMDFFRTWFWLLRLTVLTGLLIACFLSLPHMLRESSRVYLHQHALGFSTLISGENVGPQGTSFLRPALEPNSPPEMYIEAASGHWSTSRSIKDWGQMALACGVPSGIFGAVLSLASLPSSRRATILVALLFTLLCFLWSLLTSEPPPVQDVGTVSRTFSIPNQQFGSVTLNGQEYDRLLHALSVVQRPIGVMIFGLTLLLSTCLTRSISRVLLQLLLPPRSRWHLSWFWTADGYRVPGVQRSAS